MENAEELAEERLAAQHVVITKDTPLQEINIDPLPCENMIIQGAEQGGITDARRKRCFITAVFAAFVVLFGLLIGISVGISRNRTAEAPSYSAPVASTPTIGKGNISALPNLNLQNSLYDDDSSQISDQIDNTASVQARRDAILAQFYIISGENQVMNNTSARYAAANWILDTDPENLDATSPRLVQRYVIVLLYYSLSGERWLNSSRFLSSSNECLWYGIYCLNGRVFMIELANNTMHGTIPNETGALKELQVLNVGSNFIRGSVPESFYNLTGLKFLDMSENLLTGSISSKIGNLKKLGKCIVKIIIPHLMVLLNVLFVFAFASQKSSHCLIIKSMGRFQRR